MFAEKCFMPFVSFDRIETPNQSRRQIKLVNKVNIVLKMKILVIIHAILHGQ